MEAWYGFFSVSCVFVSTKLANAIQRQEFIFAPGESSHREGVCPAGNYKTEKSFAINHESGFTFAQEVRSSLEGIRVDGEIHIKPITEALGPSIRVNVVTCASDPDMTRFEATEAPDSSITMISPDSPPAGHANHHRLNAYVHAQVTIWVRPGTILPKLKIRTQSLSIILAKGLQFRVEGQVELVTTHGFIESRSSEPSTSIDARDITIQTASGSVKGAYSLYDLLSINTLSGSIDINLDLQEISTSNPKPAKLLITTLSGQVHVNTPLLATPHTAVPLRDYQSSITSQSSKIDIVIPHGSTSTLRSLSGRLSAALHPCGDPAIKSSLSSDVASGATRITIHRSRTHPTSALRKLYASHQQKSGSLRLHYPSQWEGDLTGETLSGAISIDWPGLNIIRNDRRRIAARKGDGKGEGNLEFSTLSGNVDLSGGDFYN